MNSAKIVKVLSIIGVAAGSVSGLDQAAGTLQTFANLPQRYMTVVELGNLMTMIRLRSLEDAPAETSVDEFVSSSLETVESRRPGEDLWGTKFRIAGASGSARHTVPSINENFALVSAGPDRRFGSDDDVIVVNGKVSLKETRITEDEVLAVAGDVKREAAKDPKGGAVDLSDTGLGRVIADLGAGAKKGAGELGEISKELGDELGKAISELDSASTRGTEAAPRTEASAERKRYDPLRRLRNLGF